MAGEEDQQQEVCWEDYIEGIQQDVFEAEREGDWKEALEKEDNWWSKLNRRWGSRPRW